MPRLHQDKGQRATDNFHNKRNVAELKQRNIFGNTCGKIAERRTDDIVDEDDHAHNFDIVKPVEAEQVVPSRFAKYTGVPADTVRQVCQRNRRIDAGAFHQRLKTPEEKVRHSDHKARKQHQIAVFARFENIPHRNPEFFKPFLKAGNGVFCRTMGIRQKREQ